MCGFAAALHPGADFAEDDAVVFTCSPHEFVQDALHPHLHAEEAEAVSPEQAQEVDDEPVALLKHQLLAVKNGHLGGDVPARRDS